MHKNETDNYLTNKYKITPTETINNKLMNKITKLKKDNRKLEGFIRTAKLAYDKLKNEIDNLNQQKNISAINNQKNSILKNQHVSFSNLPPEIHLLSPLSNESSLSDLNESLL